MLFGTGTLIADALAYARIVMMLNRERHARSGPGKRTTRVFRSPSHERNSYAPGALKTIRAANGVGRPPRAAW